VRVTDALVAAIPEFNVRVPLAAFAAAELVSERRDEFPLLRGDRPSAGR
jgi:hypothetical protein